MEKSFRIAGIVLAAGLSKRAGPENKLLADVGGRPMIARVIETVGNSGLDPVIVVTGHQAVEVRRVIGGLGVQVQENPDYEQGMGTSIKCGIEALPGDIDGAVICLGDMPEIKPETIQRLVQAFDPNAGYGICVPVKDGRRGNPVLFGVEFFSSLRDLGGDHGGRKIIAAHPERVCEVAVDDEGVLVDYDAPKENR
ncbi:MAG: nucleotidyltransferase family protein [Rhodospirillales bacterium]|nr:nucleotidyltransferase family protein [Rhodospirillales bacterium]